MTTVPNARARGDDKAAFGLRAQGSPRQREDFLHHDRMGCSPNLLMSHRLLLAASMRPGLDQ
jgi:hypothetical protein